MKKTRKFILPVVLLAGLVAWIYGLVTDAPWLPRLAYPLWIAIALSMIGYVISSPARSIPRRSPSLPAISPLTAA